MDIVKRLSLNKTPKDVENNSIVAAKNIMLDNTGSFITNESGFSVAFECPNKNEGEYIVGGIPCAKEVVIFTHTPEHDGIPAKSNVYRYFDEGYYVTCITNWQYNGGTIIGAYTYNYKKELIIAVSEYGAVDSDNNPILVPIKSWNLDSDDDSYSHNIEEIIPKFTSKYNVSDTGSLLSGVYTLFIRFKVGSDSFTKWFQITDDIIILNLIDKEGVSHNFMNSGSTGQPTTVTLKKFVDFESVEVQPSSNEYVPVLNNAEPFTINDNDLSSKAIVLSLNFDESCQFDEYQIGYIYKRNTDVVGRIKSTYKISTSTVELTNNDYIEEVSIDNLLESPHQFYNVKNVINYNNRLYIANYEEYNVENLQQAANNIKVQMQHKQADNVSVTKTQTNIKINLSVGSGNGYNGFSINNEPISYEKRNNRYYVKNPKTFIKKYIAEQVYIKQYLTKSRQIIVNNITESVSHVYTNEDNIRCQDTRNYYIGVLISSQQGGQYGQERILYSTYGNVDDFDIEIREISSNVYRLVVIMKNITQEKPVREFILNDGSGNAAINIAEDREYILHYRDGQQSTTFNYFHWLADSIEHVYPHYYSPYGAIVINTSVDISTQSIIINSDNKYNNNRTLIPYQIYSFYVHFIRPDLSYTDGFPLDASVNQLSDVEKGYEIFTTLNGNKCFKILRPFDENTENKYPLIIPEFSFINNTTIPDGYIGWFITYEDVEKTVIPALIIQHNVDSEKSLNLSSSNIIFDNETIYGNKLVDINSSLHTAQLVNFSKKLHRKQLREAFVETIFNNDFKSSNIHNDILAFVSENNAIYSKSTKTLYRLTNNIFETSYTVDDGSYMYLPGFYNKEKIVFYDKDLIIAPTASNVLNGDGQKIDTYNIFVRLKDSYNDKPTNAYSIYKDYAFGAVSLVDADGVSKGVYYNKVLSPDNVKDFLELKDCFKAKQDKVYTNYSKNHIDNFSKTIYRSNIISDESLVNAFRDFEYNNYKNILENKGDITNIIGVGLYLIIHTQYSMFVFDRSPKLTQRSQLDIPDAFEIDYQEVMPSNEGFGGLADRQESILTKHGYIWFDKINKYIFTYENGAAKIISQDVSNFIKNLDIDTIRFVEDIINNRLLICIYLNSYQKIDEVTSVQDTITLSYSFVTKTFISLHDYTFTDNFRTYNQSYIFDATKDNTKLYIFDKASFSYKDLLNKTEVFYKKYINEIQLEPNTSDETPTDVDISDYIIEESGSENQYEPEESSESDDSNSVLTNEFHSETVNISELRAKNYIDIIFNAEYDLPKVLNYISYILSEINSEYDAVNVSEEYLNRRFSGNAIEIYSDECYTGTLDITQKEIINKLEEIKVPYWNKGCWNLNYFRNKITTPVTGEELATLSEIPYYNKNTRQTEIAHVNLDKLKSANLYNATTNKAAPSDNRSLISGKYFVVRFIFNNDKKFKLDELSFNVNKY